MRTAVAIILSGLLLPGLAACAPSAAAGNLLLSDHDLSGYNVLGSDGAAVGDVNSLIVDLRSGEIRYVVVELPARPLSYHDGVAPPLVPVPWSALEVDGPRHALMIPADRSTLEIAPRLVDSSPDFGYLIM
jgi:sporulation protein YlmC with PRC-barrel domain